MIRTLIALSLLVSTSCTARALSNKGMVPLVTFGTGIYNVIKTPKSAQFQFEYRTALSVALARPFIGTFITSRAAFYLYAGIGWDLHFSRYLVVTPSFAPGLYLKGKDKDLGFPLEFRTCLDVAYKFPNKGRLGLQFYHLSNASIGEKNPGSESLVLYYALPLGK